MTAVILKPSKDTKWLTLEVCKDYAKGECEKSENECKFAHPPVHVEASNGKVICCFDSIKSKCQRTNPPCKYLHPPAHLRDQLLEMGRQNLIFKNLQLQNVLNSGLYQPMIAVSNSHNFTHHQSPSIPYSLGVNSKPTLLSPSYQTIVLPRQHYETASSPYILQQTVPSMQPYQLISPQTTALPSNAGLIQLVNPSPSFIYLNGTNPPMQNTVSLAHMNQAFPGVQILPYNDSISQQPQYQQNKYQQPQLQQQKQQQHISNHWEMKASTPQVTSQNTRKRNYDSSITTSSSSSSSLIMTASPDTNQAPVTQDYFPCSKKPALVDLKGGLPLYAPNISPNFQSAPHFIPITIAQPPTYIHRI